MDDVIVSEFLRILIFFMLLLPPAAAKRGSVVNTLRDDDGDSVVSEGGRFELGFFTPHGIAGSSEVRRYVGIWYHGSKPEVVVWVANRDKPLHNNNGVFTIKDGNLKVLDSKTNNSLWSTNIESTSNNKTMVLIHSKTNNSLWSTNNESTSNNITMVLMDSGNLVLEGLGVLNGTTTTTTTTLWQSFQNPTDTFLPGMNMTDTLKLTSWKSAQDPSPGSFTFFKDLENSYIIEKLSERYWVSKEPWQNFNKETNGNVIVEIVDLLSNNNLRNLNASNSTVLFQNLKIDYFYTRLVLDWKGVILFVARDRLTGQWDAIWREPASKCSVFSACGSFANCRTYSRHTCKCLPGFEPKSKDKWNSGDYSDGCQRQTEICPTQLEHTQDFFTTNMKVRKTPNIVEIDDNKNCRTKCLESCKCQAYSEVTTNIRNNTTVACAIWDEDLQNIWESTYASDGIDINVRFKHSDIEYTKLDCALCGSNIVPYPLSTGPNCGDPKYRNFICLDRLLVFLIEDYHYFVRNIDPKLNTFTINVDDSICRGNDTEAIQKLLKLEHSLFKVRGCDSEFNEINIQWEKPLESICNSTTNCFRWPNSLCNSSSDGTKRCLCKPSFKWTGAGCLIPPEDVLYQPSPKQRKPRIGINIIFPVTIVGLLVIFCSVLYIYHRRRKLQNVTDRRTSYWRNQETTYLYESEKRIRDFMGSGMFGDDDRKAIEVPVFDLDTILIATDNFSEANKLGRGGFGTVYKGLFPGGLEIAIKRLSQCSAQGIDEFKNEAILIAKLQHRNLVRLLGYCVSEAEKMLVYEYMPNKSLDFFIFDRTLCLLVNWEMRFNIIVGIVRGLVYLHEDSRLRIIHRDMKTSNVLLDGKMNPKISDFGLARIFDGTQTEAITTRRIVGTYGYMSPEYALDGLFSVKSDVFSFGIVVLEIVSGRRNTGFYKSKEALNLLGYVWNLWREKRALEIAEVAIRESCNPSEIVKCVAVGLLCVQEDPNDRPTMSNIAFMLSSGSDPASLPDPKRPAFIDKKSSPSTSSATSSGLKQEIVSHDCSLLEPR